MRRRLALFASAALACGYTAPASAASLLFSGALTLEFVNLWAPVSFTGSGVATSFPGGFSLPANAFVGTETATTLIVAAPPITGNEQILAGHGVGSFSGAPFGGSMPLAGQIRVLAYGNLLLFTIPLNGPGGAVGAGGTITGPGIGAGLTVQAAPWTTAFQSFPSHPTATSSGIPTLAGFDNRNAKGVGTTRLVTHYTVTLGGTGGSSPGLGLVTLDLSFVPEPPGALGAGLGLAVLAALVAGRRRTRRR